MVVDRFGSFVQKLTQQQSQIGKTTILGLLNEFYAAKEDRTILGEENMKVGKTFLDFHTIEYIYIYDA